MGNIFYIIAKDDFIDQKRRVRLIQGNRYELIGENEDNFEVIDEIGKSTLFGIEHFYYECE